MNDAPKLRIRVNKRGKALVQITGSWTLPFLEDCQREIANLSLANVRHIELDGSGLSQIDTSGAWALSRYYGTVKTAGGTVTLVGFLPRHEQYLRLVVEEVCDLEMAAEPEPAPGFVEQVGRKSVAFYEEVLTGLGFIGEVSIVAGRSLLQPSRLRRGQIARHVVEIGLYAVPIVCLMSFLISIVLAYQGAGQLTQYGADIFTVDLVAVSLLREMGVLLTAIMVAGRSGSAFAAEIGVMNLNEESDALQVLGLSPLEVMVIPRMIGIVIALPLLTFLANMSGLAGAAVTTSLLLDLSMTQFLQRLLTIDSTNYVLGLVKAPFFAFLIGVVGCLRGMQVRSSAEAVGRYTTVAVVQSIFLVILADALFSIVFSAIGL